jgi:hypothetical protein
VNLKKVQLFTIIGVTFSDRFNISKLIIAKPKPKICNNFEEPDNAKWFSCESVSGYHVEANQILIVSQFDSQTNFEDLELTTMDLECPKQIDEGSLMIIFFSNF